MINLLHSGSGSGRKSLEPWRQHAYFLYTLPCKILALSAVIGLNFYIPGKKRAVLGLEGLLEACRVCFALSNLGREHGELQFDNGPSYLRAICRTAEGNANAFNLLIIVEPGRKTCYIACGLKCASTRCKPLRSLELGPLLLPHIRGTGDFANREITRVRQPGRSQVICPYSLTKHTNLF